MIYIDDILMIYIDDILMIYMEPSIIKTISLTYFDFAFVDKTKKPLYVVIGMWC